MPTVAELKELLVELSKKIDVLADRVTAHHAVDAEKCKQIEELRAAVFGDNNGKKGIRRELDEMKWLIGRYERVTGIASAAAITSAVAAAVTLLFKL